VNGHEFEISKFKAQFISPAVSRILSLDPTQCSFEIDIPGAVDYFESISSLCNGQTVSIDQSLGCGFGAFCQALENDELIKLAIGNDPVSISNVGWRLSLSITDSDIGFACEHFGSLDHSSLPAIVLELLLADARLTIESEDWLLGVVENRVSGDGSLIRLLDSIQCEYLSATGISTLLSMITPESISSPVWSSICRRLQVPISHKTSNPRVPEICIVLDRTRRFDGVFAHLWRKCGRNPHSAGLIAISVNTEDPKWKVACHDIIAPKAQESSRLVSSDGAVDHYVKIDLKDLRLVPSGYSVKALPQAWDKTIKVARSWRFEGSVDDSIWETLDRHTDSDELAMKDREASFQIYTVTEFRFLRIIMAGMNSQGIRLLGLQRFEVFGLLRGQTQRLEKTQ
jgi:hypothetical protein